ncbi:MAG: hypothetical protein QOD75_1082 [Blastocatellia bacterium]|jgi:hypothetical protein|nr:hypothetical protein [Blastocatellia bacterium]
MSKAASSNLPVVCTLTGPELQERRRSVLQQVRNAVVEIRELANGYAYCFPSQQELVKELAQLIDLERQCCPFLTFRLTIAAETGPLWLEMTGPEGTKEFLQTTFTEA